MNYYSDSDNSEFDDNNLNNDSSYGNIKPPHRIFKSTSTIILLVLVVIIIVLLTYFILNRNNYDSPDYNTQDKDSSLSQLSVNGGRLEPDFAPDVIRYTVIAEEDVISFECQQSSSKAKVEDCDKVFEVTDEEITHNIKVTAEDGNITRYYLTIKKS